MVGRSIPNKFKLQFSDDVTPERGTAQWDPILDVTLPLSRRLDECFVKNRVVTISHRTLLPSLPG
jgi:hypothetical protein